MKKSDNVRIRKRICLILAVCWMAVIFVFSARSAELSTKDSMSIGILFGRFIVPSFADLDAQCSFRLQIKSIIRSVKWRMPPNMRYWDFY